mmetsp:Transcript_16592/g.22895  ORF Transcript_16592/g.22895 Transcript_16592/m.22895 type:complete len:134 (-) Transcript_16592:137-538(-)
MSALFALVESPFLRFNVGANLGLRTLSEVVAATGRLSCNPQKVVQDLTPQTKKQDVKVPNLCGTCGRRFGCECNIKPGDVANLPPQKPGPEECCQSAPQCRFCVWTIYYQEVEKYKEATIDRVRLKSENWLID